MQILSRSAGRGSDWKEYYMEKAKTTFQGIYGMMWEKPALLASHIKTESTALIIIDIVNGFVREGAMKNELVEDIIEPAVALMKFSKEHNMPVLFMGDCHDNDSPEFDAYPKHCLKGSTEAEPVDEIKEEGGYIYMPKKSTNPFFSEGFKEWLEENPQITDFIVTGTCTDICVMQFCLTLKAWFNNNNKKSDIILPLNAVETFDQGGHNITLTNTMAVYFMEQMGIDVFFEINLENKIPFAYRQA